MNSKRFYFSNEIIKVELTGTSILISYLTTGHYEGIRSDVSREAISFGTPDEAEKQYRRIAQSLVNGCGAINIKKTECSYTIEVLR